MEQIVIVDAHDVVLGTKERDDVLMEDIYRVSALWLTNSEGKILMAQRAFTKKKNPGKWGPAVAGTVEAGETYASNIVKETIEEIGLTVAFSELTQGPHLRRSSVSGNYFVQWYFLRRDCLISELTIAKDEVEAVTWYTKDELVRDVNAHPEKFLPSLREWLLTILDATEIR